MIELLQRGVLSIDPLDIEVNELIKLLITPHICKFIESYTEITTKNFYMPDLPDITFTVSGVGVYGTVGSIGASRSSHIFQKYGLNGISNEVNLNKHNVYENNNLNLMELKKPEATLTGGGKGTALPPVEGTVKMIGIQKNENEDLGITVVQQQYMSAHYGLVKELVIKRILAASRVEQLDLLHEGDVIREANGIPVDEPETLQNVLRKASGTVMFKIIPGYKSNSTRSQLFLRAHFSYDPYEDNLIPCKEAGLAFDAGCILQILKQEDPYWWQARHYNMNSRAGLIPSIVLEERRKAFIQSAPNKEDLNYKMFSCGLVRQSKKKVVIPFCVKNVNDYDSKNLVLYEEVAMVSGFQRPVICLIGAPGVGRRTLQDMIIRVHRERYQTPIAHTSKSVEQNEDVSNTEFCVELREKMQMDNVKNQYVEFGEFDDEYYGTKYESIRSIIQNGKTCLFSCSIRAVMRLRNSEFMPYVIMLAAPSVNCMKAMYEYGMSMGFTGKWKRDESFRKTLDISTHIERDFRHLIDLIVLCDNIDNTFEQLMIHLEELLTESQWVPAKWLY